ncbi:cytochrome P450 [Nocardia arthritidis]|uniref:Cytochrome P450 n=1 Tax=Nocardia arthritidis TaxID=228602 RepID=A0A6G9Y8R6_9NOCA|nr:cytochrome P450 [Nocardia arthritidis]QIS09612.1 cytochrome P450 [Nocardia arthritidis]
MAAPAIPPGFDFTDPDLWARRRPAAEFAELRRCAPIWWNPQPAGVSGFDDGGYWVVTKLEDVKEISRRPELFSSSENTAIIRYQPEITREQIEMQRMIMLNMDPPAHTKSRRIVSRGFTPRAVAGLRAALTEQAARIVHEAKETGGGDFVELIASELPLQAIAELLGVPRQDRHKIFHWSNQMIGSDDPEFAGDSLTARLELMGYAWNLAEERDRCPADDIVTRLIQADIDGEHLTADEFAFFVVLLSVAGNETTRNSITHGMKAFLDNPDQWELYKQRRPRTAPDEIVRWATPVSVFQRTATRDTDLGGVTIRQGQRVGMFYASANFDEDAFDEPFTFDVLRDPNPHVGFGGAGTHYCLGANLARLEIDLMFNAIADAIPHITQISEPEQLRSGWINGIKRWQVRFD